MMPQQKRIKLPYPHPGQQAVHEQMRRFNWGDMGRRWRKTTLGMSVAVERAVAGERIGWGAPTYKQVRIGWKEMYKAAAGVATFHKTDGEVQFPNGGIVFFRSLDKPDNARGLSADGWIIDEASQVSASAFYDVIQPMLIENDQSWMLALY